MIPITITSDYGTVDYRVAAIKGSIYTQLPESCVVDISHSIIAYNLLQTAYIVRSAYRFFPKGSIHIICVDSFYHKDRKNILAKVDGHYFILADNGLLSLIFNDIKPEEIYEITLGNRFDDEIVLTAIEIFVPVAVHLAKGGIPDFVGKKIDKIKENTLPRAIYNEAENIIVGEIIYIDNFGNAISNINKSFFSKIYKASSSFKIIFRNFVMTKVQHRYTDIVTDWEKRKEVHGNTSAIFNERNLLEITIYKGNKNNGAASLLGLKVGERIFVEFVKD